MALGPILHSSIHRCTDLALSPPRFHGREQALGASSVSCKHHVAGTSFCQGEWV